MGRELQKKKRRSKRQPVRPKTPAKLANPRGNTLIAHNWDKKQTLAQNYRRLGLVARLKAPTGGTEKKEKTSTDDALAIAPLEQAVVSEAKVQRDADGKIVRVLRQSSPLDSDEALDDDDDDDDDDEDDAGASEVVRSLIAMARNPAPKKPRHQSDMERQWLQRLVARHGSNTAAMARDRRLNPMQQTASDIARRIGKAGLAA
ncbi:hypothetical protein XA68_16762 [Ophiocordyceps unilateralis]|uniref:Nucleolar protein 16 n=1 Tax=Ophiocordyceps unilateralis TaxID=268505 RepID=A0A2A9P5M5_OPHUN|nr:hypothetical protein XA68_16762 [Ophiocordyceps unilateralis]